MKEKYIWNKERLNSQTDKLRVKANLEYPLDSNRVLNAMTPFIDQEEHHHSHLFQSDLVSALSLALPEFTELTATVRDRSLSGLRFVVVDGLGFEKLSDEYRDTFILGFSSAIGVATPTDQVNKKVLWPVKPDPNPGVNNTTFSQRTGMAEYHTDTQYFEQPEQLFSLWSIQPDKDGNGLSGLIDGRYVAEELNSTKEGREVAHTLAESKYPFRVPSVFTSSGSDQNVEVWMAPIIGSEPYFRYRRETIDKGVAVIGQPLDPDQLHAINHLDQMLLDPDAAYSFLLERGQVIFANNHELLHSRSHFEDPNRHLIRVRMNPRNE